MRIAETWTYPGGDPCGDFFGHYLRAVNPDVPENAAVLEIGCAEFDWLTPAKTCWPWMAFTGVDWRLTGSRVADGVLRMHGNVLEDIFQPDSFDLIVAISALEHIGLGHYREDPLHPGGDTVALGNAMRWLKPGGWLLFDVPYDPISYCVMGTKCRVYNDHALAVRFGVDASWCQPVYCEATDTNTLIEKPTASCQPFHYVGLGWRKPA